MGDADTLIDRLSLGHAAEPLNRSTSLESESWPDAQPLQGKPNLMDLDTAHSAVHVQFIFPNLEGGGEFGPGPGPGPGLGPGLTRPEV